MSAARRRLLSLLLALASAVMLTAFPLTASAASETVKVGYFKCGDYFSPQGSGGIDSYDAAFLEAVSDYSGLSFEFVDCGTWSKALSMLNGHQIDLLGTMQKTTALELQFSLCQNSYGTTAAELVTLPGSGIEFEDYEAIGSARMGILKNYVRQAELDQLILDHAMSPEVSYYATQEELFAALESGSVDIIAANSHTIPADWKVVEKFAYHNFYFATWLRNYRLIQQLDDAIIKLGLYRAGLKSELQKEYFPGLILEPFSVSELRLIESLPELDVFINDGSEPLCFHDDSGGMTGILVELCDMIKEETGLKFNYRPLSEKSAASGKASIVVNSPDSSVAGTHFVSDSFFTTNFLLYCRSGSRLEPSADGVYTVVLPQNRRSFIDYLELTYPNCEITQLETPEACLRAVSRGEADLTMLSSYLADNICKRKEIGNIVPFPSQGISLGFSMILSGSDAEALTEIINKGIARMDESAKNTLQFNYALNTVPDKTLGHFIRSNAAGIILTIILMMTAAGALIYARMLAKKNAAIKKANAAKSSFLSTMSHDIRTPMNAIINIAKLAQDDYAGTGSGNVLDDLKQISSVSDFLMGLLNDVLDMSSIESGRIQLHPEVYHYEEFLTYIRSIFQTLCAQKSITFTCDRGSTNFAVYVDRVRFNQVFFNLLSNAVKYTPAGGTVTYRVTVEQTTGETLSCCFEVSDTGCGMSEEFQARMFEPFERERATRDAYQGTGLGLSIAKKLVDSMGGDISVKSAPGQGTSFFVRLTLPVAADEPAAANKPAAADEPAAAKGAPAEPYVSLEGRRVLAVEDNETNIIVLTRFLAKKGVVCAVARDGEEGVRMFESSAPGDYDLILMDIRMPVMDGLEATRLIRALDRPDAKEIPILAMTADAFDNDVTATRAAGMNAHLTKPIVPELLYRTIGQFCK